MKKILLFIDDDEDDHELLITELAEYTSEVSVLSAFDAKEGLDLLETVQADWIFLDVNMPKMDGLEVLKQIKLSGKYNNIPVYIFSTADGFRARPIAMALGAKKFFKKPSTLEGFKAIFEEVFNTI